MYGLSVVVAQKDPTCAHRIAQSLRSHVRQVFIAKTVDEMNEAVAKLQAQAAVVDLEMIDDCELRHICRDFGRTAVVATHRAPDEEMWISSLSLGAADCCQQNDLDGILRALSHSYPQTRTRAHAA